MWPRQTNPTLAKRRQARSNIPVPRVPGKHPPISLVQTIDHGAVLKIRPALVPRLAGVGARGEGPVDLDHGVFERGDLGVCLRDLFVGVGPLWEQMEAWVGVGEEGAQTEAHVAAAAGDETADGVCVGFYVGPCGVEVFKLVSSAFTGEERVVIDSMTYRRRRAERRHPRLSTLRPKHLRLRKVLRISHGSGILMFAGDGLRLPDIHRMWRVRGRQVLEEEAANVITLLIRAEVMMRCMGVSS